MILRNARADEAHKAYQCIEDARSYHKSLGFVQWYPGYPTVQTIQEDIEAMNRPIMSLKGHGKQTNHTL